MTIKLPQAPPKTEIIPIHNHDMASFMRCRRYWDWSSPSRAYHLRVRADLSGINLALWFGTGVHYSLEEYYNPFLVRDPVESFIEWYQWQWEGGEITPKQLDMSYDPYPEHNAAKDTYTVRGLRDIHPDPDHEEFEAHREMGIGMLTYYRDHFAPEVDADSEVIAAEHVFSIPLGFDALDPRDGEMKPVHLRGKMDAIFYNHRYNCYGIREHKTADSGSFQKDDYWDGLAQDPQVTRYAWAAQEEAKLHDLPYKEIRYIDYNVLRKAEPKPPTVLQNGIFPSLSRSSESTTAALFMEYVKDNGLESWLQDNEKAQVYLEYLNNARHGLFMRRDMVWRNEHELANSGEHARMIAIDMLNNPYIYPNLRKDWSCLRCQFRAPCLAKEDGSDYTSILDNNYEANPYGA